MNNLIIKNLELWGKHGKTGDEPRVLQPFRVDLSVTFDFDVIPGIS